MLCVIVPWSWFRYLFWCRSWNITSDINRFCCKQQQFFNPHTKGSWLFGCTKFPVSVSLSLANSPCPLPTEIPPLDFITITHCHFTFKPGETYSANCHHPAQITPVTISSLSIRLWVPAGAVYNMANSQWWLSGRLPGQADPTLIFCNLLA